MKISAFIEVVLIFTILLIANYFFDPFNLLYKNFIINIYLYALVIITLFYGFIAGVLFYVIYFITQYILFKEVNIFFLSHYFIFLSIIGEFTFFWNRKIKRLEEENKYFKDRVENLGTAYYLLKISHDELEQNYILKPFSIREILKEIKQILRKSIDEAINIFLSLLKRLFKIEKASIFFKEDEKFVLKGFVGEKVELDEEDVLVKSALTYKNMTYVANMHNQNSKYIAVIPIVSLRDELKGIFIIKEIPFFNLTKDTLIIISLFLTYFINIKEAVKEYQNYPIDSFIAAEIANLSFLSKKFKVNNYIVLFKIKEEIEKIKIEKKVRGSDIIFEYKGIVVVVLPFTSSIGVMKFIDKIKEEIKEVEYKILDLSKYDLDSFIKVLYEI
jgi:hypothetical protein